MVAQERAEPADDLVEEGRDIDRHDVRRPLVERSYRGQDRVHQPVQPLDLVDRPVVPLVPGPAADHVATLPPDEGRLLGEQVGVRPDDGQRCAQLVGHERDQLGSSLVERLERLDLGLGLDLDPTLLDDPGEEVGDRAQLVDVRGAEVPGLLGLDVENPDDRVVPGQRHRQHRGDEPALVDAPDPEEPRIVADVGDDGRAPGGRDPPRDPFTERHPGATDLVAVETVRCGEGQAGPVAVEQVERRDVGPERVAGLVDDRLEQLVPGPGRRRQAGHTVKEAELIELILRRRRTRPGPGLMRQCARHR